MTRARRTLAVSLMLFLALATFGVGAAEFVDAPESAEQGAPVVFRVQDDGEPTAGGAADGDRTLSQLARSALLTIETPDGERVHTGQCFRDEGAWVCLTGIPSTLQPGSYRVSVVIASGAGTEEVSRSFAVASREFLAETIALNRSLTRIRTADSRRRAEEAEALRELVSRFNPESVFETGPFTIPVSGGRRTSEFGDRRTYRYVDGASANAVHYGIDIAAEEGTPVRAGGAGRVVMVADRVISGKTVVIEHLPGVFGLHYHLAETAVSVGDRVSADEIIGTLGATGLATGPHLHWEVRVSRVPVNPDILLSRSLLPERVD